MGLILRHAEGSICLKSSTIRIPTLIPWDVISSTGAKWKPFPELRNKYYYIENISKPAVS